MRVKDMSRRQQKAVFANMTDDRYLATLEGAEKHRQRKAYLLKRHELSDTYETKIFEIYNDSKLTHRQKMGKIASLKKEAKKKLDAYQEGASGSIAGEIRADNLRKFGKKYNIEEVPVKDPKKSIEEIADAPMEKLLEQRMVIEKRNEVQAREKIRTGVTSLGDGITAINKAEPGEIKKAISQTREANREINKGRAELVKSKRTQFALEKELKKTKPHGDLDKDGVKNSKDCRPFDKKKQDLVTFGTAAAASFVGSRVSKSLEKKKGTEHAGKRRYGVYWSGERVGSFETKADAQADIKEKIAAGNDADDLELVLESYQGEYIKTLK